MLSDYEGNFDYCREVMVLQTRIVAAKFILRYKNRVSRAVSPRSDERYKIYILPRAPLRNVSADPSGEDGLVRRITVEVFVERSLDRCDKSDPRLYINENRSRHHWALL